MVAFLFAGQGSQYVGMGRDLYETFPESRAVFEKADRVLNFALSKLCFEGPLEELTKTQNCQPAILSVSIAAFEAFKLRPTTYDLRLANFVAGLSLGEYSALVAAEALSFEDAVYLVRKRGEFMEEEAKSSPGKMASILGLDLEIIRDICQKTHTEIANINSPGQVVISGEESQIKEAESLALSQGAKRVVLLEVSGAFHSSSMKNAALRLAQEINRVNINTPKIPLVSNITARPTIKPEEIRDNLVKQVTASVLWEDSMRFMLSKGINQFFEFGPGKVLKGLMRSIDKNAQVINIEKKEDVLVRGKE